MIGFEKATNQRRTTSQLYQLSIEVRTVFHIASILQIRCFNCLGVFPPGNSHRQLGPTSQTSYCLWTSLWKLMVSLISMPFPNTSQQHGMQRMGSWVMGKGGCFIGGTNWIVKKIMVGFRRHDFGIFWGTMQRIARSLTLDMRRE